MAAPRAEAGRTPAVSVVIPSFESARYAERAVASVLAQSFRDFEVVLVDDGSGPAAAAALDALAARVPEVRLVRQANAGAARARRAGWEAARGRLVAFLDDDDRYLEPYLERCAALLAAEPGLSAVYTRYYVASPAGERLRELPARGPAGRIFADEVRKSAVKTSTLMVRREALLALGRAGEGYRTSENYDLILRLCYAHRFGFVAEPLVIVEDRPNSLSKDASRRHQNRAEILEALLRRHPEMDAAERRAVRRKAARYYGKAARRRLARRQLRAAAALWLRAAALRAQSGRRGA